MWESLVIRLTGGQEIAGSNPVIPTVQVKQLDNALIDISCMDSTQRGIYKITVPSGKVYVGMTSKTFDKR